MFCHSLVVVLGVVSAWVVCLVGGCGWLLFDGWRLAGLLGVVCLCGWWLFGSGRLVPGVWLDGWLLVGWGCVGGWFLLMGLVVSLVIAGGGLVGWVGCSWFGLRGRLVFGSGRLAGLLAWLAGGRCWRGVGYSGWLDSVVGGSCRGGFPVWSVVVGLRLTRTLFPGWLLGLFGCFLIGGVVGLARVVVVC